MKVECPNCGYEGDIVNKLIPNEGQTIKCPNCGERFHIEKSPADLEIERKRAEDDLKKSKKKSTSQKKKEEKKIHPHRDTSVDVSTTKNFSGGGNNSIFSWVGCIGVLAGLFFLVFVPPIGIFILILAVIAVIVEVSVNKANTKTCPECRSSVHIEASVCKYCGHRF